MDEAREIVEVGKGKVTVRALDAPHPWPEKTLWTGFPMKPLEPYGLGEGKVRDELSSL